MITKFNFGFVSYIAGTNPDLGESQAKTGTERKLSAPDAGLIARKAALEGVLEHSGMALQSVRILEHLTGALRSRDHRRAAGARARGTAHRCRTVAGGYGGSRNYDLSNSS